MAYGFLLIHRVQIRVQTWMDLITSLQHGRVFLQKCEWQSTRPWAHT